MVAAQEQMRRGNRTSAVDHAKQAAAADPLSTGPWIWLLQAYRFEGGSSQAAPGGAWFAQAVDAAEQVIQRDPYWLEGHKSVGDLYLQHARRTESKTSANEAVRAYRRCVELYPTSARRLGDLSDALWQNGETQEARARAQEALQAEQLTKHPEKHLHPEVRRRLHERIGAADRVSPPSPGTASSRRASTDG
jgi:tetratricopeptide (TPR) repeat protein